MVPTFTCGFVRSNFFFAIAPLSPSVRPPRGSSPRPRPYQGRALPTELGGQSSLFRTLKESCSAQLPRALGHEDYPPGGRKGQEIGGKPRLQRIGESLQRRALRGCEVTQRDEPIDDELVSGDRSRLLRRR